MGKSTLTWYISVYGVRVLCDVQKDCRNTYQKPTEALFYLSKQTKGGKTKEEKTKCS